MTGAPWPRLAPSYDAVASAYEQRFVDELDGKPRDRELLAAFVEALPSRGPVLDVGCGPGQIGAFVGSRCDRPVLGVDVSAAMAKAATTRLDGGVVGDVLRLPFASGHVAGVVAFSSLIHLRRGELTAAATEIARVLRPGGQALASFHEGEGEIRVEEFLGEAVPFVATLFALDELRTAVRLYVVATAPS